MKLNLNKSTYLHSNLTAPLANGRPPRGSISYVKHIHYTSHCCTQPPLRLEKELGTGGLARPWLGSMGS